MDKTTLADPKTALAGVMLEISCARFSTSMATFNKGRAPSRPCGSWECVAIVEILRLEETREWCGTRAVRGARTLIGMDGRCAMTCLVPTRPCRRLMTVGNFSRLHKPITKIAIDSPCTPASPCHNRKKHRTHRSSLLCFLTILLFPSSVVPLEWCVSETPVFRVRANHF